jgi:hypothetical protein
MRSRALCATLGLSLLVLGCGAKNEGAAPATTPAPPPIAAAKPPSASSDSSGCISREARAAVEACPDRRLRQPARRSRRAIARPAPAPLDPRKVAGGPPASDPCSRQARITEATLSKSPGKKDEAMRELEKQLDVYRGLVAGAQDPSRRHACAARTAQLLTETAMAWHLEAVGSGGVRGTGDVKTMEHAARLYELLARTFKQEDFAKIEFPHLVREDWPTISRIRYALADILYFAKDWKRCGPAFDAVVAEDPDGPEAAEASYASVLCYQNVYAEAHSSGEDRSGEGKHKDLAPRELTEAQRGMIAAFGRYICSFAPAPSEKEAYATHVEVKYARARTYFEAQRWEEAAVAFRDVALSHADSDVGIYAAQLYLESINMLASSAQPTRPVCYDDMGADVPRFVDLYCRDGKEKQNLDACEILNKIQRDLDRLRATHP